MKLEEVTVTNIPVTAWCCSICSWWWFCSQWFGRPQLWGRCSWPGIIIASPFVLKNQCESSVWTCFYPYQGPSPPQRTAASLDPWSPAGHGGDNGGGDPWGGNIVSQSTIPDPWGGIGAHGVPPSRASPLAFHQGSPPQADPWGSGGESAGGGGLYPNLGGAGVGGPDPWAAQPQQASASPVPAPVDPFSPGSPVKTSGSADLLAADWTGNGAANGNGGILGAAGGNGSPSHMAPQVSSDMKLLPQLSLCSGGSESMGSERVGPDGWRSNWSKAQECCGVPPWGAQRPSQPRQPYSGLKSGLVPYLYLDSYSPSLFLWNRACYDDQCPPSWKLQIRLPRIPLQTSQTPSRWPFYQRYLSIKF